MVLEATGGTEVDRDLDDTIRRRPVWRAKENLRRTVPGIGPVVSRTLRADLLELGALNRKQIAALAELAPMARDSGTLLSKRVVWGGRGRGEAEEAGADQVHAEAAHILNASVRANTTWTGASAP